MDVNMIAYKGYDKPNFAQIFKSDENFETEWNNSPFAKQLEDEELDIKFVFALLYSEYGSDVPYGDNLEKFKYQIFSLIFQYGPTWTQELRIQKDIRKAGLDINNFREGSMAIVNHAYNPSTPPAAGSSDLLGYINEQNVNKNQRSLADGYALLISLMKTDITYNFLNKFRYLFDPLGPTKTFYYVTED